MASDSAAAFSTDAGYHRHEPEKQSTPSIDGIEKGANNNIATTANNNVNTNNETSNNDDNLIATPSTNLGRYPVSFLCPKCGHNELTKTKDRINFITIIW
eukprot:CAMPEP_0172508164 /NCGR_PEP_ID=MMETSP1066-20121228/209873_1 /TAXON_ID=671091 /ORGANISM="Coscinodiscus wailesii, Strain CCMP2513" /LENGTH=99 /DNA_ID=CAMNT_0013286027 /DNA_START=93 /DNA_END=389 /DNA_ORIENTATION=-